MPTFAKGDSINTHSPSFRDILLGRNVIADTILDSGLDALMQGIGTPTTTFHNPEAVQPSESIEIDGIFRKDLNVVLNKYQGTDDDYEQRSVNFLAGNTNSTWAGVPFSHEAYYAGVAQLYDYTIQNIPASGPFQGGNIREFNTTKNNYLDVSKQRKIDFNTQPVPSYQVGSYLDEFGNLNVGGPDTQVLDVVGSLLTGGGIGLDPNGGGAVSDFDVRSSLAGRALNAGGAINDTRLGQMSVSFLATAIGNNALMNAQSETIGRINLNPLSLLQGNNIIVPNYSITVAKGKTGKAVNLLERMLGFEVPVSLLDNSSSIFADYDGNYVANIARANEMVANTGKGQVLALIANLDANLYKPGITDSRKKEGTAPKGDDGTNYSIYAFGNGNGDVWDMLNHGEKFVPEMAQSTIINEELIAGSGFDKDYIDTTIYDKKGNPKYNQFIWGDTKWNKASTEAFTRDDYQDAFFGDGSNPNDKKSILYKTKNLFETNKMRTLVSGGGIKEKRSQIQSGVRLNGGAAGYMSKGSGVLSSDAINGTLADDAAGADVFCRTWSPVKQYDTVDELVRHGNEDWIDGINPDMPNRNKKNLGDSVLDNNGFAQIGPYKGSDIQKFMFSIENLAWADNTINLLPCEVGPGDSLTGNKGRIMWFPPYDLSFNESTSVNWERNNFIGRGEPVYTYNNTERTGTLSWKIVIDHPNYMNFMQGWSDDKVASFVAGCLEDEKIVNTLLTPAEREEIAIANATPVEEKTDDTSKLDFNFNIYFKNDATDIPTVYENGINSTSESGATPGQLIIYKNNPTGEGQGLGTTKGEGIVGGKGTNYNDRNNFGKNGYRQQIKIPSASTYLGWMDTEFGPALNKYIKNECKYCRITINGYASTQGNADKNQELSTLRSESVQKWLLGASGIVDSGDEFKEKRVKISKKGGGEIGVGCTGTGGQDREVCKDGRIATITVAYDPELKNPPKSPTDKTGAEPGPTPSIPFSRFYTECDYFEKLEQSDKVVYDTFEEKIKNFHPAFHSITPEGFNSRLNFLQQCTRQGPSRVDNDLNGKNNGSVDNLAFGRPPVCILRLGDFYYSKIIIESLTTDYEPLVWDLNPEGVGVQPMIANITMSFAFVGGSSLKGPINKLQNAVSYNYFANTEMYDPRAERIKIDEGVGTIVGGEYPNTDYKQPVAEEQSGPVGKNKRPIIDEEELAEIELEDLEEEEESTRDEEHLATNLSVIELKVVDGKDLYWGIKTTDGGDYPKDMEIKLNSKIYSEYEAELFDGGAIRSGGGGQIATINLIEGETFISLPFNDTFIRRFKKDDSITATILIKRYDENGLFDLVPTNKTLIIDRKEE